MKKNLVMKRLCYLLAACVLALGLTACNNEKNSDYPTHVAMVTAEIIPYTKPASAAVSDYLSTYYILFDTGKTGFPSETYVPAYQPKERQRILIAYRMLEKAPEGYDYGLRIYDIEEVLTKEVIQMTAENAEEIGDDPIDIVDAWVSGGYCNIRFRFVTNGSERHLLNLVDNLLTPDNNPEAGYTDLWFRQNAFGDTQGYLVQGYVSFKLGAYNPSETGAKGIRIHYTDLSGREQILRRDAQE